MGHLARSLLRWPVVVWLAYAALLGFVTSQHEMWHDELQVWGLARESKSIGEVIANIRYDSTPPFWHLAVFAVAQFTGDAHAMQVLHVALASAAVGIFLLWAPFTRLQRVLFAFGYFPFFEYGVISRSYVIGELFLFAFLACFPWVRARAVGAGIAIVLMSQSSFFGAVLGGACGLVWFAHASRTIDFRSVGARWTIVGLIIAAGGLLIAGIFIRQHPDSSVHNYWDFINFWQALRAGTIPWRTLIPIPALRREFWNTNILDTFSSLDYSEDLGGFLLQCVLSLGVLALIIWFLRKQRLALGFFLVVALPCLAFFYTKKLGYLRHHGTIYLAFIAAAWLSRVMAAPADREAGIGFWGRRASSFLTCVLALNVAGMLIASAIEVSGRFAADEAAAQWVRDHGYEDKILVTGPGVAALLDRDVYLMRNQRFGRFYFYREPWKNPNPDEFASLSDRLEREYGRACLFVLPTDSETNVRADLELPGFERRTAWTDCLLPHDNILILERVRTRAGP